MNAAPAQENCPSCSEGSLVRTDTTAGGLAKHFSCGHIHLKLEDAFSLSDYVRLLDFLGVLSAETTRHDKSFGVDALLVNMQQEMYRDALFFFREARRYEKQREPFQAWRSLRAAVLFSFAAVEACINQFIHEYVGQNRHTLGTAEIDYWTEKSRKVSLDEKLKKGITFIGRTSFAGDCNLWSSFQALENLRDGLVHYKPGQGPYYESEFFQEAEKGIRTAGDVIKRIYLSLPGSTSYPNTFDETP